MDILGDNRPSEGAFPRTHANLAHDVMIVSWELLKGREEPYRQLYYRPFDSETYQVLEDEDSSVSYESEYTSVYGNWLYAVRWSQEKSMEEVHTVRWSIQKSGFGDLEVVAHHQQDFGYDEFQRVWPTKLLGLTSQGNLLAVFSALPIESEGRTFTAEFKLGRLDVNQGSIDFITSLSGPDY